MKYNKLVILALLLAGSSAHRLVASTRDEVDELLEKQDQKDAQEVAQKEFNDANSKMNQIGNVSRMHSSAEDEDYMKQVFDQYKIPGKDYTSLPVKYDYVTWTFSDDAQGFLGKMSYHRCSKLD